MRKKWIVICCSIFSFTAFAQLPSVHRVKMDTLAMGMGSTRALAIDGTRIWYGANQSGFGFYDLESNQLTEKKYPTKDLDFRSIAVTSSAVFLMNTASPAYLIELNKKGDIQGIVYQESHKNTFYDALAFWDDQHGIALGDPTSTCMSIVLTSDGGKNWKKIPCDKLPDVAMGEAAFAASNTNIATHGDHAWVVTGGKHARVMKTEDRGKTWELIPTPIIADNATSGIFSVDFYDANRGIIVGGNFKKPNAKKNNKAISTDGGLRWKTVANRRAFGYASCVRYMPGSEAQEVFSLGTSGLYYSTNGGNSWKQILNDYDLYSFVILDQNTLIASGNNRLVRIQLLR